MILKQTSLIRVHFMRGREKLLVGRLALKDRKIYFEYDPDFIKTGLNISPLKLPLKPGVILSEDRVFEGLFGVFNDSLPDGWGRLLLDRQLMTRGINPQSISPLDRLCFVGHHGMGALTYEPEADGFELAYHENLDEIAEEIVQFQENDDDRFVDDLLMLNGSSAGARPKIVVRRGSEDWIIKFRSFLDPKDNGPIEYAYHLMAVQAKLDVPEARLFPSKNKAGYFGVRRFDRINDKRVHMHTVSGLLHTDHREPSLDYETIMKATLWLTKDVRECEKQFRAAVFNVLSYNRDDHGKNFSFIMDEGGTWHVSPAYDLTFSSGPNGEHCSLIMGEGKTPQLVHLLKLAEVGGLKEQTAKTIIDEVKEATKAWETFAKEAEVSENARQRIQNVFEQMRNNLYS